MIHFVLLTRDDVGRSVIDTRVIDVDRNDGLDPAGRVNAGIDLMLTTARDAGVRVGPIGVAARTGAQRRELRSRGAGPRRQIHLVDEDAAAVEYLTATGEISRFSAVVVVDCGDTGMSLYTVDPSTKRISMPERSRAISGRALDRAIVDRLLADPSQTAGGRPRRRALLSACRTAKEEVSTETAADGNSPILLAGGAGTIVLTAEAISQAAEPMVDDARKVLQRYLSDIAERNVAADAIVLVGGLANLTAVRGMVEGTDAELVVPRTPELAASVGAALLARTKTTSDTTSRLAFIGGSRQREWLSAMPLAVIAAILAATLMTIYAVSSSLTGHNTSVPASGAYSSSASPSVASSSHQMVQSAPTSTVPLPVPPRTGPEVPTEPIAPTAAAPATQPRWDDGPGWATTELPPAPEASNTSTRTLSPFPMPSLPTIPPGLLPPEIAPPTTTVPPAPPTQQTPDRSAPPRSTPPTTTPDAAG
ncbi:Hsp70 family protein [Gordonia sp. NPDC003424]